MLASSSEGTGLNPVVFSDQNGAATSTMLERLRYQRETGRFCDVAILVKDRQFSAHRNILAACSPYFDSIFKSTKVTKEQVVVNCMNPTAFEHFLNYIYSGRIQIDRATVSELLKLANNFLVTKLKAYCAEYLDRYLDAANCLSIKLLALKFNLPALLKAATDYFDININRCLLESVDILKYPMTQLVKVINDPKYQDVISSDVHLKLIVRWVGDEVASREVCFRQLLEACTLDNVSDSALEFLLDYSPLLSKSQSCRYLLLKSMQEHNIPIEKYHSQFVLLSQQFGGDALLSSVNEYVEDDDDSGGEPMEDEEFDESPVEGQPTANSILETFYDDDGTEKPHIRLKINFGSVKSKKPESNKLYKKALNNVMKKRAKQKDRVESAVLPMMDDDEIDGVYATGSLDPSYVTYTDEDYFDPEDVEDGEDVPVEGGTYHCGLGYCRFACTLDEDVEKHRGRVHNRNTIYMCHMCNFEAIFSKEFYQHCKTEHWPQAPYNCDQCTFSSDRLQDLLSHRLHHTEDRLFKCAECTFRGRTRTQIWAHEKVHNTLDERPMHCEECGRGFNNETSLHAHQSSHDAVRQYTCDDCGFASNNMEHLGNHRRQHTGDVFYCHIQGCEYSSSKKSQLAAHLRTHMAVRSHMCRTCGRGFIEKSHLVRHERIHLEDKPFKCDQCNYASSRRDKLKEHIQKHHSNNAAGMKIHRRRYKRAKQLEFSYAMARMAPTENVFRPITANDSVSQWADSQAAFQQHQFGDRPAAGADNAAYSPPQRAFSVTHPQARHGTISPGSMSLMNVHLGSSDHLSKHIDDPIPTPQLITPQPTKDTWNRSPTTQPTPSQDVFVEQNSGILPSTNGDPHRPMSLPSYGQHNEQNNSNPHSNNPWWP